MCLMLMKLQAETGDQQGYCQKHFIVEYAWNLEAKYNGSPSKHKSQCRSRVKYIGGAQHERRRHKLLGGSGGMPPLGDFYI